MSSTRRAGGMRLVTLLLALTFVVTAASSVHAKRRLTKNEQRKSVVSLLAAYEVPLHKAVFDLLGPEVDVILVGLASDSHVSARLRIRAVAGLGYYKTSRCFAYLQSLLMERSYYGNRFGIQIRRQALRSLGKAFGDSVAGDLLSVRTDTEPLIREAVAHGLGDAYAVSALPYLRTWLDQEQVLSVRIAVDLAITRIERH